MKTAFVLYPNFTALDVVGPYEVISRWPDAELHFLARSLEPVRCDEGLTVIPTTRDATLPDPELIVVPGSGKSATTGSGARAPRPDPVAVAG
jgi:putative intracellular protease/amidase